MRNTVDLKLLRATRNCETCKIGTFSCSKSCVLDNKKCFQTTKSFIFNFCVRLSCQESFLWQRQQSALPAIIGVSPPLLCKYSRTSVSGG